MAHAEGMHRETRREQDAHLGPAACATPAPASAPPAIHPQQPEPCHRRRPACQGRLHDSCTTTGKASTMKVQGKCSRSAATAFSPAPASHLLRPDPPVVAAMSGQRAQHRPQTCAQGLCLRHRHGPVGRQVLPLRRASSRIATALRHAGAHLDQRARSSASRSRPGGPLRAASCSAPARSFRLPRTGPSCRTRRAGRARCRAQGGLPAARAPHPQPSQCQPCQPARATRCDGRCDIRRHVCLGARSGAHASILAMRRISTTPAVSSAASSASTPQPAGAPQQAHDRRFQQVKHSQQQHRQGADDPGLHAPLGRQRPQPACNCERRAECPRCGPAPGQIAAGPRGDTQGRGGQGGCPDGTRCSSRASASSQGCPAAARAAAGQAPATTAPRRSRPDGAAPC